MTLSRVVVLPAKVRRFTKYCSPSVIRIVTSTVGVGRACDRAFGGLDRLRDPGTR